MEQAQTRPITLRRSAVDRYLAAIGAALILALTLFILIASALSFATMPSASLILAPVAILMAGLFVLTLFEARDRWRTRIELGPEGVKLRLPRYLNRPPLETEVAYAAIAAIDQREEAFRSLGMAAVQQAYALRLREGGHVVLGGDKAMADAFYGRAAQAIAERAGVPFADLGMVDGGAGLALQTVGLSAPAWTSASLPPEQIAKRRGSAAFTWRLVWVALAIALLARFIAEGR